MLAGVCGGLARYFGIHPAFYRVGFVVLTLIGGAGILVYLAAALVIPDEGKEDSIAAETLRDAPRPPLAADRPRARSPWPASCCSPGSRSGRTGTPPGSCSCSPAGRSCFLARRSGAPATAAPPAVDGAADGDDGRRRSPAPAKSEGTSAGRS